MSNRMRMAAAFGEAPRTASRASVPPPGGLKGSLDERPSRTVVASGVAVVRHDAAPWIEHPTFRGVSWKILHREPRSGVYSAMVRIAAGGSIPARRHHAVEELFVVEGSVLMGEHTLSAGNYCRAEVDSVHPILRSERGCTLLLCGSENDAPVEGG